MGRCGLRQRILTPSAPATAADGINIFLGAAINRRGFGRPGTTVDVGIIDVGPFIVARRGTGSQGRQNAQYDKKA